MELKQGYKQTDIGIIPEDWEVDKLDKIANFYNGKAHEQAIDEKGNYIVVNSKFISTEGNVYKSSSENICPLEKGTITMVMSDIPNGKALAKCFMIPKSNKYTLNQRICAIKSDTVDNNFLIRVLNRNSYYLSFDSGTGQTNLKKEDVLNCPIAFPKSKQEQKAIAQVLSDTDNLIQAIEQKLTKKRAIKQGAMQQLLTPKEDWEVKKLGDFLVYEQPTDYIVTDTEYNDNYDIPVLTAGKSFILGYTNEKFGIFKDAPVIIFDDFTTATKFVDFHFKVKSSAMKILKKKNDSVNIRFIYELMQQIVFPLGDHKRHWIGEYQHIEIKLPNPKKQTRIAIILSDMDAEIAQLEQKLSKYKLLKQGLMQNLLTGKIRLV